jgi:hypothetical protein
MEAGMVEGNSAVLYVLLEVRAFITQRIPLRGLVDLYLYRPLCKANPSGFAF